MRLEFIDWYIVTADSALLPSRFSASECHKKQWQLIAESATSTATMIVSASLASGRETNQIVLAFLRHAKKYFADEARLGTSCRLKECWTGRTIDNRNSADPSDAIFSTVFSPCSIALPSGHIIRESRHELKHLSQQRSVRRIGTEPQLMVRTRQTCLFPVRPMRSLFELFTRKEKR